MQDYENFAPDRLPYCQIVLKSSISAPDIILQLQLFEG